MTVFLHELRRGRVALLIWALAIGLMLSVNCFIYPEMQSQMEEMNDLFANMGALTDAFGMDQLNFSEFVNYFGVECGNMLGLGGAIFAAILGIAALSKEERDHTAEFLLTSPLRREQVIVQKLLSILTELLIFNGIVIGCVALSMLITDVEAPFGTMARIFFSNFLLQLQISAITFGLSAFLRSGGIGIGIAYAALSYFLNLISNLLDKTEFLKYFTPFGYTDSAVIISDGSLNFGYIATGAAAAVLILLIGILYYRKKDIS